MAQSAAAVVNEDGTAQHRWEASGEASWETAVQEDEDGNLVVLSALGRLTQAEAIRRRRKRLEQTDYAQRRQRVVRDMLRYLYVVLDASRWMRSKDPALPPGTRLDMVIEILQDFIHEYYDQNPLSHLGFIILRNGEAEVLTQLSCNAKSHRIALQSFGLLMAAEPPTKGGEFSLQNGLEVAGRSLGHQPRYASREIVVLLGALSTCDPGNLLTETLPRLQAAHIRVSCFALAAELHVCRKISEQTGGVMGVCLDKSHFRDWLVGQCIPPPNQGSSDNNNYNAAVPGSGGCEMVAMGFPTRMAADVPTLVHSTTDRDTKLLSRVSYICPQCQAKASELPTDCAVCGLKLVLAPHLARSFHHLFPVPPFGELPHHVSVKEMILAKQKAAAKAASTVDASNNSDDDSDGSMEVISSGGPLATTSTTSSANVSSNNSNIQMFQMDSTLVTKSMDFDRACFGCLKMIGTTVIVDSKTGGSKRKRPGKEKQEETLRFQCPECDNVFCADCDAFLHDTLHNCPGCLLQSSQQDNNNKPK